MIAAAGAGKTRLLVQEAREHTNEKILITTFTQENERSTKQQFLKLNGCVPAHVTIQTWFSFLIQHGVKPFQGSFNEKLFDIEINGLFFNTGENTGEYGEFNNNKGVRVAHSEEKKFMQHYFVGKTKILSDVLSKFVFKSNKKSKNAVINRISKIFTHIYIDEVQDLAGYDLELIKLFFESSSNVLLVGDPRQTTYLTSLYNKHKNYRDGIKDFLNDLKKKKDKPCEIDEETLSVSHRNNQDICDFSSLLYPDFQAVEPCSCCRAPEVPHQGIFTVRKNEVNLYLNEFQPMQLRWNKTKKVNEGYPVCNFGESKGQTYERVLIYPTKEMLKWLESKKLLEANTTKAKFYVAITRAKYSVAFVSDSAIHGINHYQFEPCSGQLPLF